MSMGRSGSKRPNNETFPDMSTKEGVADGIMRPAHGSVQLALGAGLVFAGACCLVWLWMFDPFPSNLMRVTLNLSFALVVGALVGLTTACYRGPQSFRAHQLHALLGVAVAVGVFAVSPLNAMVRGGQTRNPALYSTSGMRGESEPHDVIEGAEPYYWKPVGSVMNFPPGSWRIAMTSPGQVLLEHVEIRGVQILLMDEVIEPGEARSWKGTSEAWRQMWYGMCLLTLPFEPARTETLLVGSLPAVQLQIPSREDRSGANGGTILETLCQLRPGHYTRIRVQWPAGVDGAMMVAQTMEMLRSVRTN